jgi:hypothetical protein
MGRWGILIAEERAGERENWRNPSHLPLSRSPAPPLFLPRSQDFTRVTDTTGDAMPVQVFKQGDRVFT